MGLTLSFLLRFKIFCFDHAKVPVTASVIANDSINLLWQNNAVVLRLPFSRFLSDCFLCITILKHLFREGNYIFFGNVLPNMQATSPC